MAIGLNRIVLWCLWKLGLIKRLQPTITMKVYRAETDSWEDGPTVRGAPIYLMTKMGD
jgi:hypothetical protein